MPLPRLPRLAEVPSATSHAQLKEEVVTVVTEAIHRLFDTKFRPGVQTDDRQHDSRGHHHEPQHCHKMGHHKHGGSDVFSSLLNQVDSVHSGMLQELRAEIQQLQEVLAHSDSAKGPHFDTDMRAAQDVLLGLADEPFQDHISKPLLGTQHAEGIATHSTGNQSDCAIKVKILGAQGFRKADASEAHLVCICEIAGKPQSAFRTRAIVSTMEPVWHHEEIMEDFEVGDKLRFAVWDETQGDNDNFLGAVELESDQFLPGGFSAQQVLKLAGQDKAGQDKAGINVEIDIAKKRGPIQLLKAWEDDVESIEHKLSRHNFISSRDLFAKESGMASVDDSCCKQCKPSSRPVTPNSPVRLGWEVCGIFILLLDLIWIPMQAFDPVETVGILVNGYLILAYWTLDCLFTFNTGYYVGRDKLVLSRGRIAFRYFRTSFLFDFILIAIDWMEIIQKAQGLSVAAGAARAGRMVRIFRIVRLLRVFRLAKLRQLVHAIQMLIDSEWIMVVFAVLKNMSLIAILNHYLACLWYVVGKSAENEGWVQRTHYDEEDYGIKYLAALQWSLAQFTPGATPLQPESVGERIYLVCVLILSLVVASCFVSSITSTMNGVWAANSYQNRQTFLLKKFMKQMNLSREFGARVTRYVDRVVELRHRQVPISRVEYLKLLSGPLNVDLQTALYEPQLMLSPFFAAYHEAGRSAFKRLCSVALHSEHFAKSDTVFERSAQGVYMYCVTQGSLVYCVYQSNTGRQKCLVKIDVQEYFSEAVLWIPWKHCGHMKGITDCELMMINADKFMDVTIASKEDVHEVSREAAINFATKMQAYTSFGRVYVHDLIHWRMAMCMSEQLGSKARKDDIHNSEELEMQLIYFSDSDGEQEEEEEEEVREGATSQSLSIERRRSSRKDGNSKK